MASKKSDLSDSELVAHLASLCLDEARVKADIVVYLVEVEERRLHLRMACKSMFDFCVNRLSMSPNVANHRIAAARLVQRYPCLWEAVAHGELQLCTLVLLRNHVTSENVEALLVEIRGMSFRDVEQHLVARAPRPDIPTSIAPLPEQAVLSVSTLTGMSLSAAPTTPAARVTQLAPARFAVQLTISQEVRDKLERASDLMRHRNSHGGLEVVLDRALDALLEVLEKQLFGKTKHPRRGGRVRPGAVSVAARREIFERDGERCTFEDADGNRCTSRAFLEIDHIEARALGGSGEASNLRVLCKSHNQFHAEEVFTRAHVERAIARRRATSARAPTVSVPPASAAREAELPSTALPSKHGPASEASHGGIVVGAEAGAGPALEVGAKAALEAETEVGTELEVGAEVGAGAEVEAVAREVEAVAPCTGGAVYLERSGGASVARHDEERACLLRGLTGLGFKRGGAVRAVDTVLERAARNAKGRLLPDLLRDAIGLLT